MSSQAYKHTKITKAIIPAAGKGTRLLPLTKAIPKELIPLGNKPVLEHIIEECAQAGIKEVLFVISEDKTSIKKHFGNSMNGISFNYVFQEEQKGLADAIYCGKQFSDKSPFAVVLGDSVIYTDEDDIPFKRVIDTYEKTDASGVIVVQKCRPEEVVKYGIVKPKYSLGPTFQIDALIEKPKPQDAPSPYAVAGRYVFEPEIFEFIEHTPIGTGGEYQISDSIDIMMRTGLEFWCVALSEGEKRCDIGTFATYFEAFQIEINKNQTH